MDHKKKYLSGLKVLLLPLFIVSFALLPTNCFAVDYNDFDIPVEFWNELISYINNNVSYCPRGSTTGVSGFQLKDFYDNNLKSLLKTQIQGLGGDDRNLLIVIRNYLGSSTSSSQRLHIGFLYNNNSINNIENMRTFDTVTLSSPYSFVSYRLANRTNPPLIYQMRVFNDNSIDYTQVSNLGSDSLYWVYNQDNIVETSGSAYVLNNAPFFGVNEMPLNVVNATLPYNSTSTNYFINGYYNINYVEPNEPSGEISSTTGIITNNSGETTGKIDLTGIEQGIGNIQNQISGDTQKLIDNQNQNTETIVNIISGEAGKIINTLTDNADNIIDNTKITSGDITSSLGFIIAQDPYSNFWLTLTNNLKTALLGIKRDIDISFQGRTWNISLDNYLVLPGWLVIILTPISTCLFTWVLVRQWKLIFDKLASGNIDSILKENSEEGISNLF